MTDGGRRFRVGDKVRLMQRDTIYEIIEVIEDYGGRYRLSDCSGTWGGQYLTLVEPYDRRKDFLTRLQGLLREFNAEITASQTDFEEVTLYLNIDKGSDGVEFGGKDTYFTLTASNIMDFEK